MVKYKKRSIRNRRKKKAGNLQPRKKEHVRKEFNMRKEDLTTSE